MKKIILFLSLLTCGSSLFAHPIDNIIFFGDSLTDNGNLYHYLKFIPKSPPYFNGRFSNGPTWAENLAEYYDKNYHIVSENYAVGGATALLRNPSTGALPYTVSEELYDYLARSPHTDKSHTLFFIWIGANDYLDVNDQDTDTLATDVVNEIATLITTLIDEGAQNFVVLGLPDLSRIPFGATSEFSDRLKELSALHKQKLAETIHNLQIQHNNITILTQDIDTLFNTILDDPEKFNTQYHLNLTHTTQSCWQGGYTLKTQKIPNMLNNSSALKETYIVGKLSEQGITPCENPDEYVFWDKVHPTLVIHQILANIIEQKIATEAEQWLTTDVA